MKKFITKLCLCCALISYLRASALENEIIINANLGKDFRSDSITITAYSVFEIHPWDINTEKVKVENGIVQIKVVSNQPYIFYSKDIYPGQKFLVEPGDSICINLSEEKLDFTGRGCEKFKIVDLADKFKKILLGNSETQKISTVGEYIEKCRVSDLIVTHRIKLLEEFRQKLSYFSYSYLKAELLATVQLDKAISFCSIMFQKQKPIPCIDLSRIYDSTLSQFPFDLTADSLNTSSELQWYLYFYCRLKIYRQNGFSGLDSIDRLKQNVAAYFYVKSNFKGLIKERLLTYIIASRLIKDIGFRTGVENVLNDYYSSSEYSDYKEWVRKYESNARVIVSGKPAPQFILKDTSNNNVGLNDFRGKIVLIDFWFTGCKACIGMAVALKNVYQAFEFDTNIVFLNVSVDQNKKTWMRSVLEKKYSNSLGKCVYTGGLGLNHPIVKRYNVNSFPTLYLVDSYGNIVDNPLPDPRRDSGKGLISILNKQIAKIYDGPYVFYKNDQVMISQVKSASGAPVIHTDSTSYKCKSEVLLSSNTDQPDKVFNFSIKKDLQVEQSEFDNVSKLFVVSDIEGNFDYFRKLLQSARVIDQNFSWIFGDGHLVLLGDFFDRGPQVTECLWLIYSLEEKAKLAGGYVHFILGNHEIMNLKGDTKYVHDKYINIYKYLKVDYPAFNLKESELGRWLLTKNVVERIGKILFVHGGISREINGLNLSLTQINNLFRRYIKSDVDTIGNEVLFLSNTKTSPFWYRGYYEKEGDGNKASSDQIDSTLSKFSVDRIVTGHTIVADYISTWYNNKIFNIDTKHSDGKSEGLLITGTEYYRVNDKGIRELIFSTNSIKNNIVRQ